MSVYNLIVNQTAVQTVTAVATMTGANSGQNPFAQPTGAGGSGAANSPTVQQTFVLAAGGAAPGVSSGGAAQIVGSNDGNIWLSIGAALTVSAAAGGGAASVTTNVTYAFYGAYVTSVTGTGTKLNLSLSC